MNRNSLGTFRLLIAGVVIGLGATAQAATLLIAGSPTYDPATGTGLHDGQVLYAPGRGVNNSGMAVGYENKRGPCAVRWDASGTAATELANLGTDSWGVTIAYAYAVNDAGTAAGFSRKYVSGIDNGYRALRWDASSTAAIELGSLGTTDNDFTDARAFALNDEGTTVGYSYKYVGGTYKGWRAVRWDASGTTATELGNLGTDSDGVTYAVAFAVNDTGMAVGYAQKYVGGSDRGERAVRWDASGTTATELGNLGTDSDGVTWAQARAENAAGTAVGYAQKYLGGSDKGQRAVRWDASGTTATELGNLGTDDSGITDTRAYAVNARRYDRGILLQVRWRHLQGHAGRALGRLGYDRYGTW